MPPERLNQRSRHPSWHVHGGLVLLLGLIACQSPTGGAASVPAPSAAASPSAEGAECPDIRLRTPQGNALDLTGTWATGSVEDGNQVVYQLRQEGECLWGRAFSAFAGQESAESFDIILVGTVRSDFSVELDLLEFGLGDVIGYPSFGRASATLRIEFGAASDEPTMRITALRTRLLVTTDVAPSGRLFVRTGPEVGQVLTRSP